MSIALAFVVKTSGCCDLGDHADSRVGQTSRACKRALGMEKLGSWGIEGRVYARTPTRFRSGSV